MNTEEAIQWINTILGSKSLKAFSLTFEVRSIEDIEKTQGILSELNKNGWDASGQEMNSGPEGRFLTMNVKRSWS